MATLAWPCRSFRGKHAHGERGHGTQHATDNVKPPQISAAEGRNSFPLAITGSDPKRRSNSAWPARNSVQLDMPDGTVPGAVIVARLQPPGYLVPLHNR